jgi:hypothetical protein
MKARLLIKMPHRTVRVSLLCAGLWLLAIDLPVAVMGQQVQEIVGPTVYVNPYTFTTIAGTMSTVGTNDGTGSAARFEPPFGIAVDNVGNAYVADTYNFTIRKVAPTGVVTTIAGQPGVSGTNDGTNSDARFYGPFGAALDANGNLYVTDIGNDTIRKVTPVGTNWVVTTVAGQAGVSGTNDGTNGGAYFGHPEGLTADTNGNLYVSDEGTTIRKVAPVGTNWVVTTLAGVAGVSGTNDGTNGRARFNGAGGLAVDTNGNLYVADSENYTIRKVTPVGSNWVVTTIAGQAGIFGNPDGTNNSALFWLPVGVAVDSAGNLYVTDVNNLKIREVTPVGTNWVVTSLAGGGPPDSRAPDGTGMAATLSFLQYIAVDGMSNLYATDDTTIRKGYPASAVPAPVLQSPGLSAGQFGFDITGLPNLAVDVQGSSDLTNWQVVGTNYIVLVGGTNFFSGSNPPTGNQFYRVHVR